MKYIEYLNIMSASIEIDGEIMDAIIKNTKTKSFRNKEIIVPVNNLSRNIFFIEEGIGRVFYSTGEKDVTFFFLKENDFNVGLESYYLNTTSRLGFESIGATVVAYTNFDFLNNLFSNTKGYNEIKERLTAKYMLAIIEHLFISKITTPKERFNHLMQNDPHLFKLVPLGYIASYLGITQETLSRLRAAK